MDADGIYELYSTILPDFIRSTDIFMHDNASVHINTAKVVKELLAEMGIETMVWPPYSPDLKPIENLWSLMKRESYRKFPELQIAPDTVDTHARLVVAAKIAWHTIRQEVHESLCESMNRRVEAILEANGWYTKGRFKCPLFAK